MPDHKTFEKINFQKRLQSLGVVIFGNKILSAALCLLSRNKVHIEIVGKIIAHPWVIDWIGYFLVRKAKHHEE